MSATIEDGARVTVRTDLGAELATVIYSVDFGPGEPLRYRVRFDDDTYSSWPAARVQKVVL